MCASEHQRGFGSPEAIVGAALAFVALLAALAAAQGLTRLGAVAAARSAGALGAGWALDRLAREAARAGHGVCPGGEPSCPDEAVEFLGAAAIALRGDLDGDDPAASAWPEPWLRGDGRARTGNDEVVVYLLRPPGRADGPLLFDADLDGPDRVTLPDGTLLARRDGAVASVDAGPASAGGETRGGTLYRVTFVHDARHAGSGRFRVAEPLLDDVTRFAVRAWDAAGAPVAACGGADDAAARACRAAVRRVEVRLEVRDEAGRTAGAVREVALALAPDAGR